MYEGRVSYVLLPVADVRVPSTGSINSELETFFSDVLTVPMPVRIFPDRTIVTSSGYVTGLFKPSDEEQFGNLTNYVRRSQPSYDALWDVDLAFIKHVE
jgi:hypothetical protein